MTIVTVQCKGSGKNANAGLNAKRAVCPDCSRTQDLRSDGKFRKHKYLTRTRKLK